NSDMRVHRSLHLVVLKSGEPSPLARESDEEKPKAKDDKPKDKDKEPAKDDKPKEKEEPKPVVIDFDSIDQRIVALPIPAGNYSSLAAGPAGQIYYLEEPLEAPPDSNGPVAGKLKRFDLTKRKTEDALPNP